jgi:hypothetical protein
VSRRVRSIFPTISEASFFFGGKAVVLGKEKSEVLETAIQIYVRTLYNPTESITWNF